jgi:Flp pilus assembly CpaE family ATPase
MVEVARVVLALEEHDVAEEVMHFLDRTGRTRVVATAGDDRQLGEAVRQLEPDAVIAQPSLVLSASLNGSQLIAVDTRESVNGLRSAIRAGACGYFVWPVEREELAGAAAASARRAGVGSKRALVIAVQASRGGAGATFVSTHLSAAFARRGSECVLLDADFAFADVTAALGAFAEPEAPPHHTIADLIPVIDELDPLRLGDALWHHPEGFAVALAPEASQNEWSGSDRVQRVIDVAAQAADVVVVHLPRSIDEVAALACAGADRVLMILSLDVLSFRAGTRAIQRMPYDRVDLVVNRATRAEVTPSDVQRVFGRAPVAVLPNDAAVPRAQDHGRLLPPRSRLSKAFDRLAERLSERLSEEVSS